MQRILQGIICGAATTVVATFFVLVQAQTPSRLIVVAQTGDYVELDSMYRIVRRGVIWEDAPAPEVDRQRFERFGRLAVLEMIADPDGKRLFARVGTPQADRVAGYLVFRDDDFKLGGVLEQEATLGPSGLLVDRRTDKIYLSHLTATPEAVPTTSVFSATNYKKITEYKSSPLLVGPSSCLLKDDQYFFANWRIFSSKDDRVLRELTGRPPGSIAVDCKNGRLLLVSRDADGGAALTVSDLNADNGVFAAIKTSLPFSSPTESWRLSPAGDYAVGDEQTLVQVGQGKMIHKTGRVLVVDVAKTREQQFVRVFEGVADDLQALGFSPDGKWMLYASEANLIIAATSGASATTRIGLPFRPSGLGWLRASSGR